MKDRYVLIPALALLTVLAVLPALASSHCEAPAILDMPEVDATQLDSLQKALLTVTIVSPGGTISGPLQ